MCDESIKTRLTSGDSRKVIIHYFYNAKIAVKFDGSCLKQDKVHFIFKELLVFYIVYEINLKVLSLEKSLRIIKFFIWCC